MKKIRELETKHGSCYPKSKREPLGCTKAFDMLDQKSSTSGTSLGPLLAPSNEEKKAVEAYKLQVEKWRSMAIELARRNAIR